MNHTEISMIPIAERLERPTMGADSASSLRLNLVMNYVKDILSRSTKNIVTGTTRYCKLTLVIGILNR